MEENNFMHISIDKMGILSQEVIDMAEKVKSKDRNFTYFNNREQQGHKDHLFYSQNRKDIIE